VNTFKTFRSAVTVVALGGALAAVLAAAPAQAATTSSDESYMRSWFTSQGVPAEVQDQLIAKLDAGKPLDSMVRDAVPINITTRQVGDELVSTSTYADGSVLVSSLETPSASGTATTGARAVTPQSISGCKESNGGGYVVETNCRVENNTGTFDLFFNATYERYTGGAQIDKANGASVVAHYGSATKPTVGIKRAKADGSYEAYATEHSYYTAQGGKSSEDLYLSLRVNLKKAYTTNY